MSQSPLFRIVYLNKRPLSGVAFSFLEPKLEMALAFTPKAVQEILEAGEKSSEALSKQIAFLLENSEIFIERGPIRLSLLRLRKKVEQTRGKVSAFLTDRASKDFEDACVEFFSLKSFLIKDAKTSKDLRTALKYFDFESAKRLDLLKLESPHLPWLSSNLDDHFQFIKKFGADPNYVQTDPKVAEALKEHFRKKKMLLHVCCGPDAGGVIQQLKNEYDLTCFWYDPNIQPREEYDRRLETFLKVAEIENVPVIVGEYDVEHFYARIKGLEHTPEKGAKCSHCYDMRLERSAQEARDGHFDVYSTTLAISPHKVQEKLKNFGALNEKRYGVPYLARNYLKDDGFKDSVSYTKEHAIYRQDYCGCYFSLPEGGPQAQKLAADLNIKVPHETDKTPITNPFRGVDKEHPYLGVVAPKRLKNFRKSFFNKRSPQ